jgi:ribokinase
MPNRPRVVVVGSSNTDLVIYCEKLPHPGETVFGGHFQIFGGGKGANQAVAAARAGGRVTFVGAYGADTYGEAARDRLVQEGISVEHFHCLQSATSGVALILVDNQTRENMIAVAKSANELVDSVIVSHARPAIEQADIVLSQLEIRDSAIEAVARLCHELKRRFVLNPAPARSLHRKIYESLYAIVVNEHEAESFSGLADVRRAIRWFHEAGCKNVVVTLGAKGAIFSEDGHVQEVPARPVDPVDTTGAGDCFVAWLGVGIGEGLSLSQSVERATKAASIAVTRAGAQSGMPYPEDVSFSS